MGAINVAYRRAPTPGITSRRTRPSPRSGRGEPRHATTFAESPVKRFSRSNAFPGRPRSRIFRQNQGLSFGLEFRRPCGKPRFTVEFWTCGSAVETTSTLLRNFEIKPRAFDRAAVRVRTSSFLLKNPNYFVYFEVFAIGATATATPLTKL